MLSSSDLAFHTPLYSSYVRPDIFKAVKLMGMKENASGSQPTCYSFEFPQMDREAWLHKERSRWPLPSSWKLNPVTHMHVNWLPSDETLGFSTLSLGKAPIISFRTLGFISILPSFCFNFSPLSGVIILFSKGQSVPFLVLSLSQFHSASSKMANNADISICHSRSSFLWLMPQCKLFFLLCSSEI